MTIREKMKEIFGAEDMYNFVKDPINEFKQVKWNQWVHEDGVFVLFDKDSNGNIIGCRSYC